MSVDKKLSQIIERWNYLCLVALHKGATEPIYYTEACETREALEAAQARIQHLEQAVSDGLRQQYLNSLVRFLVEKTDWETVAKEYEQHVKAKNKAERKPGLHLVSCAVPHMETL